MLPQTVEWITKAEGDWMTLAAVDYRYPGAAATKEIARQAVKVCRDVRQRVRVSLGLL